MRFAESSPVRPLDPGIIKGVHGDEKVKLGKLNYRFRMIFKVSASVAAGWFLHSPLPENSEQRLPH